MNQAIIISDLHCGCQFGLCPPTPVRLDGGGTYQSSTLQQKMWSMWREMWDEWVPEVTRGEPFALVINGDTTDGRHHGSTSQVSQNLTDQKNIAMECLLPVLSLPQCHALYMIRGTEAHVGPSGENEENLAASLGAIPDDNGNHARFELWLRIGGENGALAHILHHIGTTGSTHYETSALNRALAEACSEAGRWGYPAPDFVIRAHRHRWSKVTLPTRKGYAICEVTPAWQLKTPFCYRIPGGAFTTAQWGGILIRQGDEEHYSRAFVKSAVRSPEVVI